MKLFSSRLRAPLALLIAACYLTAVAADPVQRREGDWVVRDFRFHTGEVLPELRLHCTTLGEPTGEPVVVLHGTGQSAGTMLAPPFAGKMFGAGQPLDLARYYVILPDAVGHGKSSKPSDGLRAAFPKYDYDDMVDATHRLLAEHLGVRHVRLVLGNLDGRDGNLVAGREASRLLRHRGADGVDADPDVRSELDDASPDRGLHRQDPRVDETSGHGTTFQAKYWKKEREAVLQSALRVGD